MNDLTDKERCSRGCIYLGAGVGAAVFLMFWLIAGWGWLLAIAAGAVLGGVAMFLFSFLFCGKIDATPVEKMKPRPVGAAGSDGIAAKAAGPSETSSTMAARMEGAKAAEPAADVSAAAADPSGKAEEVASGGAVASSGATKDASATAPVGGAASEPTAASAPVAGQGSAVIKPSKPLKGEQELSERKGSYTYHAPAAETAAPKKASTRKKVDAEGTGAKKAAADAPAKQSAAPAPLADIPADTPESKPETLSAARAGGADDLKRISGVGPKLEQTLNELGFYHFDQIAKWGPEEIAWVDSRVRFKGRITRDNWMAQAKILAEGGETEFSARTKKT